MALTIRRLRWFIAAAALLLTGIVVGYISLGRYRAVKAYLDVLRKAGVTVSHDTNGYTYSKTEKGRTVFTLHAKKGTQLGDGKWSLHGVNVILYSHDGKHNDVINGDEFTYDEKEGIVRAIGEVHMDIQAPDSLATAGHSSMRPLAGTPPGTVPEPANVIHVRTSGVEYLQKLGVATTDQQVEFFYGGIQGTAIGAEFDTDQNLLRLLSNVMAQGNLRGQPFVMHATSADIDRTANIATLPHTVATSQGHNASADLTVLNLRTDGSIASARATGHVTLSAATQTITAAQLDGAFTKETVPTNARLSGGVQLIDTDPLRPTHGSAAAADMVFDARGLLSSLTATGSPQLSVTDKRTLPRGLLRDVHGDRLVALFSAAGNGKRSSSQLKNLHATGSAQVRGEALAANPHTPAGQSSTSPQVKVTTLNADDLNLTLLNTANNDPEPDKLTAVGHTLLTQVDSTGATETSAGDQLNAVFAQADVHGKPQSTLASAVQTGHVLVHRMAPRRGARSPGQPPQQEYATGSGETATYDAGTEKLMLTGHPHFTQDTTTLTATTIVMDQATQDADATGNVQTTFARSSTQPASQQPAQYTHVLSSTAHFSQKTQQAEFHGTDAQPARMWQEGSQVQAATLIMDDRDHTFSARPASPGVLIHAVFASTPSKTPQGSASHAAPPPTGRARYVRVASARMDYSDTRREAVFTGEQGVLLEADAGTIHAQRATAYLTPAVKTANAAPNADPTPFNGSLDRVVIAGDVRLDQPGRQGTGEQLVYTAVTGASVLTGTPSHPPHIQDAQQGNITGTSLLFADAGSTIVVSGDAPGAKPVRVHTETHVQQGKEERQ